MATETPQPDGLMLYVCVLASRQRRLERAPRCIHAEGALHARDDPPWRLIVNSHGSVSRWNAVELRTQPFGRLVCPRTPLGG